MTTVSKTGNLKVLYYPNDVLRRKCCPVTLGEMQDVYELISMMRRSLDFYGAVGLAAPQVGCAVSVLVTKMPELHALVNPVIVHKSNDVDVQIERCISLPDVVVHVKRPTSIVVEAVDEYGESVRHELDGFCARAIQHEVDHLEGKLIIDYASSAEQAQNRGALKRLEKRSRKNE